MEIMRRTTIYIIVSTIILTIMISGILNLNSSQKSEWIGFWGNVIGGVIGTMGAFLVANWTVQQSSKRKKVEISLALCKALEEAFVDLYKLRDQPKNKIALSRLEKINEGLSEKINKILPDSIEAGSECYKVVDELTDSLALLKIGVLIRKQKHDEQKIDNDEAYCNYVIKEMESTINRLLRHATQLRHNL